MLVSIPDLGDDNFDQSVVLVIEHDDEGALGLVLNRPSATPVAEHLPDLVPLLASPAMFFVGGPVAVGGLLALGRRPPGRRRHLRHRDRRAGGAWSSRRR